MSENIKDIIHAYFGKHISKVKPILFARWLLSSDNPKEKENTLHELWEDSPSNVTISTYKEWAKLQKSINKSTRKVIPFYAKNNWLKNLAAVVIIILITIGLTTLILDTNRDETNIELNEVFVSLGDRKEVILPDGSKVRINSGSLLIFPKSFDNINTRTIYLTGEADFDVVSNRQKPFIVKTVHMDVEALGTVFTVQAYPTEQYTSAMLEQGSIRVDLKIDSLQSIVLKPNEQLKYSNKNQSICVSTIDASTLKWMKEGYHIFDNTSFQEIVAFLERKYNVVILFDNPKYAENYYNVKFASDESIEDVLSVLQGLVGFHFNIKGKIIYIN